MRITWGARDRLAGHEVKLIPPAYVKPFVKRNKTMRVDAEAICESSAAPPSMRYSRDQEPKRSRPLAWCSAPAICWCAKRHAA